MNAAQGFYWSIEACGWVRSPVRPVEVPDPRPADALDEVRPATSVSVASTGADPTDATV